MIAILPVIGAMFIASLSTSSVPVAAQERNEIVWMTGYWGGNPGFIPFFDDRRWGTYFMYEPMFGTDVATGKVFGILGESIEWIDEHTIEVKLRDDTYWTDGQPITAEDVKFTYFLLGCFDESPSGWGYAGGEFKDRVGSMTNFEVIDDKTFRVHIKAEYPNSEVVYRFLTRSYLIVPKHVWEEIYAEYPDLVGFTNDWTDPGFPEKWKVASGPYLPYTHSEALCQTIMVRNDDWWGKDHPMFGRLPAPKYLGLIWGVSNPVAQQRMMTGEYDWCGNYIAGIDKLMEEYPHIQTYLNKPPYYVEKSVKLLVPNHRKYPISENWLRKAISMVINYDAISGVSSGYLRPGSPLYIPKDDVVARELLNEEIEQKYAIRYDVDAAIDLLEQYCIKVDGTWYTKDGPRQEWLDLYGADAIVPEDALPDVEGHNVPLGPWKIIDIAGWTDVNMIDIVVADCVKGALGIDMGTEFVGWYQEQLTTFNFDFANYVMHWGMNGTMYERYHQLFSGTNYMWNHYGDFRHPTLENLIEQLDTVPKGTPEQQEIANQIQEIIGQEMPFIPIGTHPDWANFSTMYWEGWPNEAGWQFLPCSPYPGAGQNGTNEVILLNIYPKGGTKPPLIPTTPTTTTPTTTTPTTTTPTTTTPTTTTPTTTTPTTTTPRGVPTEYWVIGAIVVIVVIIAIVLAARRRS